jgi:hypothetical protein
MTKKKKPKLYRFGGAHRLFVPPATLGQLVEVWWHRGMKTSPGMPEYYLREKSRARDGLIPLSVLKFRPGAKPVLPAGIKRLEDIEGYEPE